MPRPTRLPRGEHCSHPFFSAGSARGRRVLERSRARRPPRRGDAFCHEALMYAGEAEFVEGTLPFLREAIAAGEPTMVVVSAAKIQRLREALGEASDEVRFADMAEVGDNPARIIPAWQRFVDEHAGRPVRGIGEPVWPQRSRAELVECHRHESLLNVAFARTPALYLLCPYDTRRLRWEDLAQARRTHPRVRQGDIAHEIRGYGSVDTAPAPWDAVLPEPAGPVFRRAFDAGALSALRALVTQTARAAGLGQARANDLVVAVEGLAVDSVHHGGGQGLLRIWHDERAVICEVSDGGEIDDPLADRRPPASDQDGRRGLWRANQLCELVQVRSSGAGTVVRLHMRLDP